MSRTFSDFVVISQWLRIDLSSPLRAVKWRIKTRVNRSSESSTHFMRLQKSRKRMFCDYLECHRHFLDRFLCINKSITIRVRVDCITLNLHKLMAHISSISKSSPLFLSRDRNEKRRTNERMRNLNLTRSSSSERFGWSHQPSKSKDLPVR